MELSQITGLEAVLASSVGQPSVSSYGVSSKFVDQPSDWWSRAIKGLERQWSQYGPAVHD